MPAEPRRLDFIPPPADAVALPTPELAMRLLAYLVALEDAFGGPDNQLSALPLHPDSVVHAGTWPDHIDRHDEPFLRAISEAWAWLTANGLLARQPGAGNSHVFVTRTGRAAATRPDGLAWLQAQQRLGVELHPRIAGTARNQCLLGDPEMAVLAAMKSVEIRVRELGSFPDSLIGIKLMQEAFRDDGPLCDPSMDSGSESPAWNCSRARSACSRTPPATGRSTTPTRPPLRKWCCWPTCCTACSTTSRLP
jgi:hypothetical protein